jgi:hypothetical protein
MDNHFHYATISEAIRELRQRGFDRDFNLKMDCLECGGACFRPNDFEIVEVYRYEGNSDPGDEAAVYAVESSSGIKGLLVTGYGPSAEDVNAEMLQKLSYHVDRN